MELSDSEGNRMLCLEPDEIIDIHDEVFGGGDEDMIRFLENYQPLSAEDYKEICTSVGHYAVDGATGFWARRETKDVVARTGMTMTALAGLEGDKESYSAGMKYLRTLGRRGYLARSAIRSSGAHIDDN